MLKKCIVKASFTHFLTFLDQNGTIPSQEFPNDWKRQEETKFRVVARPLGNHFDARNFAKTMQNITDVGRVKIHERRMDSSDFLDSIKDKMAAPGAKVVVR